MSSDEEFFAYDTDSGNESPAPVSDPPNPLSLLLLWLRGILIDLVFSFPGRRWSRKRGLWHRHGSGRGGRWRLGRTVRIPTAGRGVRVRGALDRKDRPEHGGHHQRSQLSHGSKSPLSLDWSNLELQMTLLAEEWKIVSIHAKDNE